MTLTSASLLVVGGCQNWRYEISQLGFQKSHLNPEMFAFAPTEGKTSVPVELTGDGRFVLSRQEFVPAYLKTYEEGRLREKVEEALELLGNCHVCPRNCEVNRLENKTGVCKSGRLARVASAFAHFGEEDCLRGWCGSGTIFFAWCNLRCDDVPWRRRRNHGGDTEMDQVWEPACPIL